MGAGLYDTILGVAGLLFIASGLASIVPLRGAAQQPPDVPGVSAVGPAS